MADVSALYPQPNQSNSIMGGNPLQTIGILSQINANARFQKEFQAKQAVGAAFQSGINPDGSLDTGKIASALQGDPSAAYAVPEAMGSLLAQRGQMIANDTNQFRLNAATNGSAQDFIAGLAGNPSIKPDDVYNGMVEFARRNPLIPSTQITSLLATMPKTGKSADIQNWAKTYQNIQAGAGTTIQRTLGPPGPSGEPTTQPLGQANVAGVTPTALPPGVGEAIAANRDEFVKDQTMAATRMANMRPIQQALPLVQGLSNLNFGPGSADIAKVKGMLTTLGITGVDPTSELTVKQEVGKKLLQYAIGARDAGRSDQALAAAVGSNPNPETMVQPANVNLIKNQIAMDRQDAALPLASAQADPTNATHKTFKSNYYQNTDTRAFGIDNMTQDELTSLKKSLGPPSTPQAPNPAWDKFVRSFVIAKKAGLLTPGVSMAPGAPSNGP